LGQPIGLLAKPIDRRREPGSLAAGDLELRESLSKMRLETAIKALKDLGLIRLEGKDYLVQDGDILLIRFSV